MTSLKDEIKKALAETRKRIAKIKEQEGKSQEEQRRAEALMFEPVKKAIDALAGEFSDNPTIRFEFNDYVSNFYEINIESEDWHYEIRVRCQADSYDEGYRFLYWLSVEDVYYDQELLAKIYYEG